MIQWVQRNQNSKAKATDTSVTYTTFLILNSHTLLLHYTIGGTHLQEQKPKRDYAKEATYKWQKTASLSKEDGKNLEIIMQDNGCKNLSQFCRKISKGEISIY